MRRQLYEDNKNYKSGVYDEVPKSKWPPFGDRFPMPTRVLRSKEFLVQIFEAEFTRLTISRNKIRSDGHWEDGITWEEMQGVKDACGYAERDAVEAYPKKRDIVHVANMRHLWIVSDDYSKFFWRDKN